MADREPIFERGLCDVCGRAYCKVIGSPSLCDSCYEDTINECQTIVEITDWISRKQAEQKPQEFCG